MAGQSLHRTPPPTHALSGDALEALYANEHALDTVDQEALLDATYSRYFAATDRPQMAEHLLGAGPTLARNSSGNRAAMRAFAAQRHGELGE